ncbi:putative S-adenosyl-L-methionine-dependent methyltransferase [Raphanus sativus]|nr:putative S-adenosyl-L-methionine-dependent methyltransferase [Raphanus sativus]
MCLSDKEVEFLAEGMLGWVKARSIHFLQRIMFLLIITRQAKIDTPLTIVNQDSIQSFSTNANTAYVKNKENQNQICWIWQKVSVENDKDFHKDILITLRHLQHLWTVMLKDAGFEDVIDEDIIDQFVKSSDVR